MSPNSVNEQAQCKQRPHKLVCRGWCHSAEWGAQRKTSQTATTEQKEKEVECSSPLKIGWLVRSSGSETSNRVFAGGMTGSQYLWLLAGLLVILAIQGLRYCSSKASGTHWERPLYILAQSISTFRSVRPEQPDAVLGSSGASHLPLESKSVTL